ncbi:Protein LIFEGUARD (Partial), partial [Seminavis robusta]
RKAPMKWWFLGLFTLGEAISVGFVSSFYAYRSVISAMAATMAATMSVSVYTVMQKNPKYDLTQWGAGLSSVAMIFLLYGIIGMLQMFNVIPANFLPYNDAIYSFLGATLFSFYLAHHTRLIVAGKHAKYQMSEKDYVLGAMTLYNDIINMFIYILRIIGEDRD